MCLFGSIPIDEVTISFGLQSSILLASSFGEKPPNTTPWTAPILVHANIVKADSMIIGM